MIKQGEENKRIEKSPTEELSRWGRFKNPLKKQCNSSSLSRKSGHKFGYICNYKYFILLL